MRRALILANLSLFVVFPIAWTAPLMRAGLLPLFGLSEISVLSGLAALWEDETALAILVAALALAAPMAKTAVLALFHFGRLPARALPLVTLLGKLSMADVFLLAVYVTLAKGLSVGRVETAWGLWLFTAAVLASYAIGIATERLSKAGRLG
ncbi:paraquat-inducible membrane protein A [Rhodobacterales bacterium HKCCE2091]|nr:paraquat-inducible membrane protein A [Rhodobacterales bacterium HKCCE2091]